MEWRTRITELPRCKYPILEGAYSGLGTWRFAAAIANTGAFGIITASVYRTPEKLGEAIRNCRRSTWSMVLFKEPRKYWTVGSFSRQGV